MDMNLTSGSDQLAEAVEDVLTDEGFRTRFETIAEGYDVLMAENDYSVAAVLSAKNWKDVASGLADLQMGLANWAADRDAGAKQWDLYLVLLLSDVLQDADLAAATDLATDLRLVRKIVRAGISPERADVKRALAPLLPLASPRRGESLTPLRDLERRLPTHGLTSDQAESALAAFLASVGGGPE